MQSRDFLSLISDAGEEAGFFYALFRESAGGLFFADGVAGEVDAEFAEDFAVDFG